MNQKSLLNIYTTGLHHGAQIPLRSDLWELKANQIILGSHFDCHLTLSQVLTINEAFGLLSFKVEAWYLQISPATKQSRPLTAIERIND